MPRRNIDDINRQRDQYDIFHAWISISVDFTAREFEILMTYHRCGLDGQRAATKLSITRQRVNAVVKKFFDTIDEHYNRKGV